MNIKFLSKLNLILVLTAALLSSCAKDGSVVEVSNGEQVKDAEQIVGKGKAYTWGVFDSISIPKRIGITFTKGALDGLTTGGHLKLTLPFASQIKKNTPFDHIYLEFTNHGHEPLDIYGFPHFDCHFMMQSDADRTAIPAYETATASKFDKLPLAGIIPLPYFRIPGGVKFMGTHWVDGSSPEYHGEKFKETLILGSYDGLFTFYEPMFTLEFLASKPNLSRSIPQGTKYQTNGTYYPTQYSIKQVGDNIEISLDGLTYR
jgi:hypothetical protein